MNTCFISAKYNPTILEYGNHLQAYQRTNEMMDC